MKRFPMIDAILKLFIVLTVGLLEKLMVLLYCLLPMGLFMLLMSLRTKNHKATAIGTFTNERSEFQHIFPNYILVIVEPNLFKKDIRDKIYKLNVFLSEYTGVILLGLLILFTIIGGIYYFFFSHFSVT